MRFGWLAAAAAMVMGAGQAQAARYYEFELVGIADSNTLYSQNGTFALSFEETIRFSFDTNFSSPSPQFGYRYGVAGVSEYPGIAARTPYSIQLSADSSASNARLQSLQMPGGPVFDFNFSLADVAIGDTLRDLNISNNAFTYTVKIDPRYSSTASLKPGQIVRLSARTSDTAPAFLGATENLVINVLPEPASWAMMIFGVGVAGAGLRRRPKRLSVA